MRSENAVNNNLSKELLTIPDLYFFGMVIFLHLINIASIRQYVYNIYYIYQGDYYGLYISKRSCTEISAL